MEHLEGRLNAFQHTLILSLSLPSTPHSQLVFKSLQMKLIQQLPVLQLELGKEIKTELRKTLLSFSTL